MNILIGLLKSLKKVINTDINDYTHCAHATYLGTELFIIIKNTYTSVTIVCVILLISYQIRYLGNND